MQDRGYPILQGKDFYQQNEDEWKLVEKGSIFKLTRVTDNEEVDIEMF